MAGPVKGTIGQDEVTLNDAATETTLLKMLAAIQKQGGSGGSGGGASGDAQKNLVKMAKATGKTTKELEDFEFSKMDKDKRLFVLTTHHIFNSEKLDMQGALEQLRKQSSHLHAREEVIMRTCAHDN